MSFGLQNLTFGVVDEEFDASQTTLDLSAGHGSRFDDGVFPERAVLWNYEDHVDPAEAYWAGEAELIEITSKSGDTLDVIAREQEGTSGIAATPGKTYRVAVVATQAALNSLLTVSSHASSHQNGGADEISVEGLSGVLADGQTPSSHASSHQNGGADEISVADLSGLLADAQTPLTHSSTHENGGADEISVAGLSGQLADAQVPVAASEIVVGGAELATQTETDAGTDDTRIVTPLKLANYSGLGFSIPYVLVVDAKSNGSSGGTFTSGAWRTRVLNTELVDSDGLASLSTNQITLQAGTWRFLATLPCHNVDAHRARLRNVTDSATVVLSHTGVAFASSPFFYDQAILFGQFTIASAKAFEVQHWCETTGTTTGFGIHDQGMADGVSEYYTRAEFWRVAA